MSSKTIFFPEHLARYLWEHSGRENALLSELREETAQGPGIMMQIAPEQGQFLALLVRAINAKRCIEVGVFTGYSSLVVAQALPDQGTIVCCDINEQWTGIARKYWVRAGVEHKIDLRLAPAIETLKHMLAKGEKGGYDFAFIDADKQSYQAYYEHCLTLLRPSGIIAVDNTLWSGAVADSSVNDADTKALRAFNDSLHGDQRVDLAMLTIGDGLTLALKR